MAEHRHRRQARRSFLGLAAAGLGLLVAGCQMIPSERPRPPIEIEPEPIPAPAPRPEPAEERNQVAVLVPLTGQNAGVGQSIANAANLALLDTGGKEIRITVYDTAGGAQAAAARALAEGNGLILGPLLAQDVRAVAPVARQAGVPVIAFSNDVSVAGNGVYLMGFSPIHSIERVVRYARTQNVERFAGLAPDGDYGRRSSQALIAAVERSGGRVVAMQTYSGTPQSLRSAVTRLNGQSGYDAVLIADTGRAAAGAAPLIRSGPSPEAKILGTEIWKTEANLGANPALRGAWFASVPDTMFNQLRTRYRARYGRTPYRLASLGYDGILLAVRIGRDWRFARPFPERELRSDEGFAGVDGAFRFGRDGVAERSLEVLQVGAGGATIVSPAPRGFGD
ncbi:MAG TPA: penicillin-binding protein activator [Allosphingosinicella sp.]|nr:penicillin-binding protein activator [Allosphingosinicella sp.]